jgi:hypothetical protein
MAIYRKGMPYFRLQACAEIGMGAVFWIGRSPKMKYKGMIKDSLQSLVSHQTKTYTSYYAAQLAAERLGKKYYPSRPYICIVGIPEPGDERREPAHV